MSTPEIPEAAACAWQCYCDLRQAKKRHLALRQGGLVDSLLMQQSLRHHEDCINAFRQATRQLKDRNPAAHEAFLSQLAAADN